MRALVGPTPRFAPLVAQLVQSAGNVRPHGTSLHCGAFAAADHWFHWSTGEEFPAHWVEANRFSFSCRCRDGVLVPRGCVVVTKMNLLNQNIK